MPLWTTTDDVHNRWISDDPIPATDEQITYLLEDVEDTVLAHFPDMGHRVQHGYPLPRLRRVVARVVIRHLRNPSGVRQTLDSAGPFQRSTTYAGTEPNSLDLTERDLTELSEDTTRRAFTISQAPSSPNAGSLDPSVDPAFWA